MVQSISGDKFHGRFTGADFNLVDKAWLEKNIRSKGPLGAQYPEPKYLMEGDTPSFLYLIGNGLGDPEHPDWGSATGAAGRRGRRSYRHIDSASADRLFSGRNCGR